MTVFLHIGLSRTGTTYLQSMLLANRAILEHHGIGYPHPGKQLRGHHNWGWELTGFRRFRSDLPRLEDMAAELERHPHAIVTSESFRRATDEQVARLDSLLSGLDVIPVMTVRNPVDHLQSQWGNQSRRAGAPELEVAVREGLGEEPVTRVVTRWGSVFGECLICPIEETGGDPRNIFPILQGVELGQTADRNRSPSLAFIHAVRILAAAWPAAEFNAQIAPTINRRARARGWYRTGDYIDDAQAEIIQARTFADMERMSLPHGYLEPRPMRPEGLEQLEPIMAELGYLLEPPQ